MQRGYKKNIKYRPSSQRKLMFSNTKAMTLLAFQEAKRLWKYLQRNPGTTWKHSTIPESFQDGGKLNAEIRWTLKMLYLNIVTRYLNMILLNCLK